MAESLLGALANSYFSIDTTLYLLISYHILEKTYSGSHRSLNSLILYMGSNSIFSPQSRQALIPVPSWTACPFPTDVQCPPLIHEVSLYVKLSLLFICLLIPVLFPPYLNEFSLWHVSPNVLCSFLIGHVCCLLSVSPFYSLAPPACHLQGVETSVSFSRCCVSASRTVLGTQQVLKKYLLNAPMNCFPE